MGKSRGPRLRIRTEKLCSRPEPSDADEGKEQEEMSSSTQGRKENSQKKIVVEKIIPLELSSLEPEHVTPDVSILDKDEEDEPGSLHIDEKMCCSNPKEKAAGASESATPSNEKPNNEDVLSVVIQKLTELVESSESICPHTETSNNEEHLSGRNIPPKTGGSKKKSRSKRYNKSQLYKCPNCPCLFAVRKRDLKKSKEILCDCCEKVKQAEAAEDGKEGERETSTPLQVVPLESWKVVCDVCSHWLSDYPSLLIHLASHDNVQIFKCKLCDFVTTKKPKIESHQATHCLREINYNKFVCSLCKFSVNDLSKMEEHLKQHDQGKLLVLKCSVCGFTCRSEVVLLYHMVSHMVEPTSMKGSQKVGGTPHGDSENGMVFKCSVCGYTCFKLSTLKSHSWKHAGEQSCSYPVEESDGEACSGKRGSKIEADSEAVGGSTEAGKKNPEVTAEARSQENKDLSRLAIGCCSSKGQSCCSEEGSKECHCKSISVPPSQQPVLEVILNEIVNKVPAASLDKHSVQETAEADQGDCSRKENSQGSFSETNLDDSGEGQTSESGGKVQVQAVKNILAECSSLIKDFCEKVKTTPNNLNPEEDISREEIDERLNLSSSTVQCNSFLQQKQEDINIDTEVTEANKTFEIHNSVGANEDSIIVVVENMDVDSFLENTASVVEVTTSDEPHPMTMETTFGGPAKRQLTTELDGVPKCKKVALSDNSHTQNCLLDAGKEQEEQSISCKTKTSGEEPTKVPCNPIICPFCDEQPASFALLKRHLLDHCRQEENFKCETCKLIFASERQFFSHQKLQECKAPTTDSIVEEEESDKLNVEIENELVDEKAKEAPVKGTVACTNKTCSHCSRKFRTKAALYLHEQDCSSKKKSFPCIECDFVGSTAEEVKEHISASHKKPFKCALCDYTSATPSGIKNHMKFHAVDKPYKCHLCDFSGAYPQSLRSHLKVHATGNTNTQVPYEQYKCKLCGYISCHLPSMKSHMWRHARDPGFKYDMMDDIIKDATLIGVPEKASAGQQRLIYVSTPLQTVVSPAQNQIILATEKSEPVENISLKENNPVLKECKPPDVTTRAPSVLIFKCTQCGFQSDSQGKLIEHLKGHLTQ